MLEWKIAELDNISFECEILTPSSAHSKALLYTIGLNSLNLSYISRRRTPPYEYDYSDDDYGNDPMDQPPLNQEIPRFPNLKQWRMNVVVIPCTLLVHEDVSYQVIAIGEGSVLNLRLIPKGPFSIPIKYTSFPIPTPTPSQRASQSEGDGLEQVINFVQVGWWYDKEVIICVDNYGNISIWSVLDLYHSFVPLKTIQSNASTWSVSVAGDHYLLIGNNSHIITLYDLDRDDLNSIVQTFHYHGHNIPSLHLHFDEEKPVVASCSIDGNFVIHHNHSKITYKVPLKEWVWTVQRISINDIEVSGRSGIVKIQCKGFADFSKSPEKDTYNSEDEYWQYGSSSRIYQSVGYQTQEILIAEPAAHGSNLWEDEIEENDEIDWLEKVEINENNNPAVDTEMDTQANPFSFHFNVDSIDGEGRPSLVAQNAWNVLAEDVHSPPSCDSNESDTAFLNRQRFNKRNLSPSDEEFDYDSDAIYPDQEEETAEGSSTNWTDPESSSSFNGTSPVINNELPIAVTLQLPSMTDAIYAVTTINELHLITTSGTVLLTQALINSRLDCREGSSQLLSQNGNRFNFSKWILELSLLILGNQIGYLIIVHLTKHNDQIRLVFLNVPSLRGPGLAGFDAYKVDQGELGEEWILHVVFLDGTFENLRIYRDSQTALTRCLRDL